MIEKRRADRARPVASKALAVCLAWLAAGCGDAGEPPGPLPDDSARQGTGDACTMALEGSARTDCEPPRLVARELDGGPPAGSRSAGSRPARSRSAHEAQVETLLSFHCGECHGRCGDGEGDGEGGLGSVDDVDALLAQGYLVAGDVEGSPLARRLSSDSGPASVVRHDPAGLSCDDPFVAPPWLSAGELALVEQLVEELPGGSASECMPSSRSVEEDLSRLAADVAAQPETAREFLRYLSVGHGATEDGCAAELDVSRWAASQLLNALSLNGRITTPVAVDPARTLYRLDLRDYRWDREVAVDGRSYDDWWDALAALSSYAVSWSGVDADALAAATGTPTPLLSVEALLEVVLQTDVYYALLDVPATREELASDRLGIDRFGNFDQEQLMRAGFQAWDGERLVERHEVEVRSGAYWQLFELGVAPVTPLSSGSRCASGPVTAEFEVPVEVVFTLPNGLLAFAEFDAGGQRLARAPARTDPLSGGERMRAGLACLSCHDRGPLPVVDEVRDSEDRNRSDLCDRDEVIRDLYPTFGELDRERQRDGELYLQARERAGVPLNAADPITTLERRFRGNLSRAELAAELRVDEATLLAAVGRLPASLRGVVQGSEPSVSRDVAGAAHRDALCALHGALPVAPAHCVAP